MDTFLDLLKGSLCGLFVGELCVKSLGLVLYFSYSLMLLKFFCVIIILMVKHFGIIYLWPIAFYSRKFINWQSY